MKLFSRLGAFVAWLFGYDRRPPPEPVYNSLYDAGREGFSTGSIDWSQGEHRVELGFQPDRILLFDEKTLVEVVDGEEVFVSYDKYSGQIEGLLDVKEFRSNGVLFVDGDGNEQFFEYETDDEDTGVYERRT